MLNLTVAGLVRGDLDPLATALDHVRDGPPVAPLDALDPVAARRPVEDLQNSGYVVHTLQTALHDGLGEASHEDAVVPAVDRGGDADTIGGVTGAAAGALFGAEALPERWLAEPPERDTLERLAAKLDAMEASRRSSLDSPPRAARRGHLRRL